MPFLLAIFATLFIVVAVRNTQSQLFSALSQDVPAYGSLLLALLAIGLVGYIPRMSGVSRGLMALFVIAIFVSHYQAVISNFQNMFSAASSAQVPAQPAAPKPLGSLPVNINVGLGSGGNQGAGTPTGITGLSINPLSLGNVVGGL